MTSTLGRKVLTRSLAVGGGVAGFAYAFPKIEDKYWYKKAPERVVANAADSSTSIGSDKKRLVILGTGWASISALKNVDRDKYDVTIVSPRNYFLFTPLLPSVCVGTITQDAVTVPIRDMTTYKALPIWDRVRFMLRGYLPGRCRYIYAGATDIDIEKNVVTCAHESTDRSETFDLPYDVLVIGTGATTNTFNTAGVDEYCHYLKQTGDAAIIRQSVLENLEKASLPTTTTEEKKKLLSFYVVGGGPTGLEFAAELQDFLLTDVVNPVKAVYHSCAGNTSVTLVQSNKHLLPGYPGDIQNFSEEHLREEGVNLLMNTRVTHVSEDGIGVLDKATKEKSELPYGLVVWATGVSPGPLAKKLISQLQEQTSLRSLKVDSHCKVVGTDNVWAIGDCADIDVVPEYKKSLLDFWNKIRSESKDSGASENKRLGAEANARFVKDLKEHFKTKLEALGGSFGLNVQEKIIEEFEVQQRIASVKAGSNKDSFQGISEEDVAKVVENQLKRQKHLPPTAQVAHQQGEYLGHLLSDPKKEANGKWTFDHGKPFSFTNLGKMVYIGGHMAGIAVPKSEKVEVSWNGALTNYVWHAAYFGMLESQSARHALMFGWLKGWIFGRSTALDTMCTKDNASSAATERRKGGWI